MAVRVQVPLRVQVVPCKTLTYRAFYFIWYKRTTLPLLLGVSPKSRLQGSWKKQVDHRDKILSGLFFQQHRLLAKVLLLRWPFQLASMAKYYCCVSMAKYYCCVGQVYSHASQPYFPSDP